MLTPCENWNERLSAWLDGESSAQETQEVEAHLRACDACRAAVELFRCDAQDTTAALLTHSPATTFADRVLAEVKTMATHEEQPVASPTPATPELVLERKPVRRSWFAELFVVAALFSIMAAILFPVFGKAREKARHTHCTNNQKTFGTAVQIYTQENNETLPSAETFWSDIRVDKAALKCMTIPSLANGYVFNNAIAGKGMGTFRIANGTPRDLNAVMLTADGIHDISKGGFPNIAYSPEDLDYRHNGKIIASFLDGHVEMLGMPTPEERTSDTAPTSSIQQPNKPSIAPPTKNYGLAEKLDIAYTAGMTLESADVAGTTTQVELALNKHDGFVLKSDMHQVGETRATATITGKVPAMNLGKLLVDLEKLGTVNARNVDGEDMTAEHLTQLESLSDSATNQHHINTIGNGTKDTSTALAIEEKRDTAARGANGTRVEEYKLRSKVTLATVTVTINSPAKKATPANTYTQTATGALAVLGAIGGFLLKVLLVLGILSPVWVPLGVIYWVWRRKRQG